MLGIPNELQQINRWVNYKTQPRKDSEKPAKVPVNPNTGKNASPTNPKTWGTFDQACQAVKKYKLQGLGFVFNGDGYVGIDIDNCVLPNGDLASVVQKILTKIKSYAEYSPSKTGVHIIVKGQKPGERCRGIYIDIHMEVYDSGRYFTMTGNTLPGYEQIREVDLTSFYNTYFQDQANPPAPKTPPAQKVTNWSHDDQALLEKAMSHPDTGAKFAALWNGDKTGFEDDSRADFHLCLLLAFWTGKDEARMYSLFCQSGLYRAKTETKRGNETYLQRTIRNACKNTSKVYDPGYRSEQPPHPAETLKSESIGSLPEPTIIKELDQKNETFLKKKFQTVYDVKFDISKQHPFLQWYYEEARKYTDAKPQTLITPLLSALAANIGNKVFIKCGVRKHYCNIWTVVVAPSTIGRKSTAIEIATNALKHYNKELKTDYEERRKRYEGYSESDKAVYGEPVRQYVIYPKAPAERFLQILSTNPSGLLVFNEIADFLSKMNKSYNADFKSIITDMFDGTTTETSTIGRGDQCVENPSFSIATATTKEWLLDELKLQSDVNSGFLQRFLMCNSHDIKFDDLIFAYREEGEINQQLQNKLTTLYHELRQIGTGEQPLQIRLNESAKRIYSQNYEDTFRPYVEEHETMIYSYIGRLFEDYFFRFCILLTLIDYVNDGKHQDVNSLVVDDITARLAHELCHFYLKNIESFLQNEISDNYETRNEKQVIKLLRDSKGWVRHTILKDNSHQAKKQFDETIERLLEQEAIEIKESRAANNKITRFYRIALK